ncbi:hypothetical protein MC7420_7983 [Coleofasciculus chthonoplastes PCC 7420]|uniref:Uncharacterized protein n=1 Tax=Coleofasciculus chthonoplastes PCC 7420 TaxID=118168 RepID=B4VIP4_9CYAN|nr:hypothetical protein MC7420_7983 [Coleofasciculus chthonoplastes PCC 7420]
MGNPSKGLGTKPLLSVGQQNSLMLQKLNMKSRFIHVGDEKQHPLDLPPRFRGQPD